MMLLFYGFFVYTGDDDYFTRDARPSYNTLWRRLGMLILRERDDFAALRLLWARHSIVDFDDCAPLKLLGLTAAFIFRFAIFSSPQAWRLISPAEEIASIPRLLANNILLRRNEASKKRASAGIAFSSAILMPSILTIAHLLVNFISDSTFRLSFARHAIMLLLPPPFAIRLARFFEYLVLAHRLSGRFMPPCCYLPSIIIIFIPSPVPRAGHGRR